MGVALTAVLADPALALRLVTGDYTQLARDVRWVAVTELADPRPFLSGGELVLTTGLRQRTSAAQREFVDRLAEAGVAAIGFGTGLTHASVPAATLAAAVEHDLPVLDVPYGTPFLAVDRFVADRVLEEQYGRLRDLLDKHDELSRALLSERGLDAMVDSLRRMLGAPVMVVDEYGNVIASAPQNAAWPVEQIMRRLDPGVTQHESAVEGFTLLPLTVGETGFAHLCVRPHNGPDDVLPYAATLMGLELGRQQAVLAGRRQLAGQVLEDVVRNTITAEDAARRLATFGIRPAEPHAVLVGAVDDAAAIRNATRRPFPVREVVTAVVEDRLVAVLATGCHARDVAHQMHVLLRQSRGDVRVGIGGWYPGVTGLRWSYYEAYEALSRGPGVNGREPMSMSGLLLASEDVPLRDVSDHLLGPLREFDSRNGGALLATLRAYLEADGSVGTVARSLVLHRNTVRYRITQIEQLTGMSLRRMHDRVQLWLALTASGVLGRPSD